MSIITNINSFSQAKIRYLVTSSPETDGWGVVEITFTNETGGSEEIEVRSDKLPWSKTIYNFPKGEVASVQAYKSYNCGKCDVTTTIFKNGKKEKSETSRGNSPMSTATAYIY